ncbi:MAG: hypothetical protein BGO01_19560 [Armatimonadetes bacterium 55-13]|nr:hypothetical protein [Armatimonadota bacterium]OJU64313.1 MAG: hypothetical protein BGO01_19560 [Armatimonadetes bacterium 55-13]
MRVFISAGEASGDAYGASLVQNLTRMSEARVDVRKRVFEIMHRELGPLEPFTPEGSFRRCWDVDSMEDLEFLLVLESEFGVSIPEDEISRWMTNEDVVRSVRSRVSETFSPHFEGIGGARMRAAGVQLYADSSKWGAISIAQAVRVFVRVWSSLIRTKKHLRKGPSGLFIPIDFGFANIRLARFAKKNGWKVLYFVPPGSWRRDRQGKDIPIISDAVVTPFPWSADTLTKMGADAYWFGHPIKQLIAENQSGEQERKTIAVLPGSRQHELEMNLPLIAASVQGITTDPLEFGLAPSLDVQEFRKEWNRLAPGRSDIFTVGDTYGVLKRAKVGIICSGTATLEAALCRCPMIVVYQISKAMQREVKLLRMKRPQFIALPNIILNRMSVPELAEAEGVTKEQVQKALAELLNNDAVRRQQLADFDELDTLLGPANAISKTAALAINLFK